MMSFLAALLLTPAALSDIVPIAASSGKSCARSGLAVDDSFVSLANVVEKVTAIGKVTVHGAVVGWIYRTSTGRFYAQANQLMSAKDQAISDTHVSPHPRPGVIYTSPLRVITRNPWPDLTIVPCAGNSLSD